MKTLQLNEQETAVAIAALTELKMHLTMSMVPPPAEGPLAGHLLPVEAAKKVVADTCQVIIDRLKIVEFDGSMITKAWDYETHAGIGVSTFDCSIKKQVRTPEQIEQMEREKKQILEASRSFTTSTEEQDALNVLAATDPQNTVTSKLRSGVTIKKHV